MSRQKIIKILKEKNPKLSEKDLEDILNIFSDSIVNALRIGKKVVLKGFGVFFIKKIKEKHNARNPKTSEIIYIPERNKVRFRPSKQLKELINK